MAEDNQEKTFTQEELDSIISRRLSEEKRKYPTDEEMAGFRAWKDSQTTENEKLVNMTAERDTANQRLSEANAEVSRLKHERYLLGKGVSESDLEYYDFKISHAVTDTKSYEQAAEEFLKERPVNQSVKIDMSAGLTGGGSARTTSGMMNDIIRRAAKNNK